MKRLALIAVIAATACRVKDPPPLRERWTDDFSRAEIGDEYYQTGTGYQITNGALEVKGAHNKPLWLRKTLPQNVQIDLTTWTTARDGDLKVEIFGDGHSFDPDAGDYTSTGYVLIFGGWHNEKSIIVKGYEHGGDVTPPKYTPKVVTGQRYHWRIVRKGSVLDWYIDDMKTPFLEYTDPEPLYGPGHTHFAFSDWENDSWFDDLAITPL
jgi:hypothetical protein